MVKLKDSQNKFSDDFYSSYKRVLEKKNTFLILEKIYGYSKKLESFVNEMTKLNSLLKTKNFTLLIAEIEKLNAYTDNHVFFLLLENVVRNDINRFVDEVSNTILANLNLDLPIDKLLSLIDTLVQLNKNFNNNDKKTLLAINQVLLSNAKTLLLENLKNTKESIQYSKPVIKYTGYLLYFSEEIEKNVFESDKNKYSYYNNFYQQITKLNKIYGSNNMFIVIGEDIIEKMQDLFSYFLKSLNNEINSLNNSKDYHMLLILVDKLSAIYRQGKMLFDEFQCEDIFEKFDNSIKTIINLAITIDTTMVIDIDTLEDSLDVVSLMFDKVENFSKNILKKLMVTESQFIEKFVSDIVQNLCKTLISSYTDLLDEEKLKVS